MPEPKPIKISDVPAAIAERWGEDFAPSVQTVWRWTRNGRDGKVLRTMRPNEFICTTWEWLLEFLTGDDRYVPHPPVSAPNPPALTPEDCAS